MTQTLVSSKFQVVIPKEVRERISLRPGQKLVVYEKGGIIHLIPRESPRHLRGLLKDRGIDLSDLRDKSNRPL